MENRFQGLLFFALRTVLRGAPYLLLNLSTVDSIKANVHLRRGKRKKYETRRIKLPPSAINCRLLGSKKRRTK